MSTRTGRNVLVLLILAVGLFVAWAIWPRRADLGAFEPAVTAGLETAMWRDYYEHIENQLTQSYKLLKAGISTN